METKDPAVYNVLVVGAGQIGAFFDRPSSPAILTHGHAFSKHPGFNLLGFVDVDYSKAAEAAGIWGGRAYNTIDDACGYNQVDVVCLAAPDEYHYSYLKRLAGSNSKLIFLEKPLVKTLTEADEILSLYKRSPIAVEINYSRRFVPEFADLREAIQEGRFGRYLSGTGYYGKGVSHNGSHMIDILRYWLGEIASSTPLDHIFDYYDDDPVVSAVLQLQRGGPFFLQAIDCRSFTHFEVDLLFEKNRIRMVDSGYKIEKYTVVDSRTYAGYRNLSLEKEINTSLGHAMYHAACNIYDHLNSGAGLLCSMADGYRALEICQGLKDGAMK